MIDPGFYMLDDGSIGPVYFNLHLEWEPPEGKREEILNIGMAKHVEKMLWDKMMNPNAAIDPNQIYSHARKEVGKDFDAHYSGPRRYKTMIQIGQKESYEEILKIESKPNFLGWEDSNFINQIKNNYLKTIENDEGEGSNEGA